MGLWVNIQTDGIAFFAHGTASCVLGAVGHYHCNVVIIWMNIFFHSVPLYESRCGITNPGRARKAQYAIPLRDMLIFGQILALCGDYGCGRLLTLTGQGVGILQIRPLRDVLGQPLP